LQFDYAQDSLRLKPALLKKELQFKDRSAKEQKMSFSNTEKRMKGQTTLLFKP
jgi:hypothetical protein